MAQARKPGAKRSTAARQKVSAKSGAFSKEERAAMKDHAKEAAARRRGASAAEDVKAVLAKIGTFKEPDRSMARRVHDLVTAAAPELAPRLWYGMPAYARDGKVVCFFQDAGKFKVRYATLGFQDPAKLDDGAMWPTAYAVTKIGPSEEKQITALVKRAGR